MLTQDAVPADNRLLENLLAPLENGVAEMSYGRQLANPDADILEKFTRRYNYGDRSFLKTEADKERLGIKTYFASNVCAAYVRARFDALGGFPGRAIFNEDMILCGAALKERRDPRLLRGCAGLSFALLHTGAAVSPEL